MTDTPEPAGGGAFAALSEQIAALHEGGGTTVTAGHLDLGPDLWLSTDPAGRAALTCRPSEAGFALKLEAGDSGAWACLGARLPVDVLARGRYLGVMIEGDSRGALSFTPTLRYFAAEGGGLTDVPTPEPLVLAGRPRARLAWIPLDPALLAASAASEVNLFFHNDGMELDVARLEILLIL
ncbi:MAG: hypothetical protein KDK53_05620 [Maritimibacter sp.]|nr:hypothetical protein [Maritimibacter sp.]